MSIQVKTKHLVLAGFLLLLATFFLGGYVGSRKAHKGSQATIDSLSREIERYEVEIKDAKAYITSVEAENKTLRQAKKDGDISREEMRKLYLKKVQEVIKAEITINVLRDSVRHNGKVITVHDSVYYTDPRKAILLPFNFGDTTKYYSYWGKFNKDGILSVGFHSEINPKIYVGIGKKNKEDKVVISTNNPFVTVNKLESVVIDKPKPQRWGIGFQGGVGMLKDFKTSPYIGIGLSYDVIRF